MGGGELIRGALTYCTASKKKRSPRRFLPPVEHFKSNFIVLITLLVLHGSEVVLNLNEQDGGKSSLGPALAMELNGN